MICFFRQLLGRYPPVPVTFTLEDVRYFLDGGPRRP
jgi:hypothetical protein